MRMTANSSTHGITCIKVLFWSPDYKNCWYRVQWACGHVTEITGNALTRRVWMIQNKGRTNKCECCARQIGVERTISTCRAKVVRRNRSAMTVQDAMQFMA